MTEAKRATGRVCRGRSRVGGGAKEGAGAGATSIVDADVDVDAGVVDGVMGLSGGAPGATRRKVPMTPTLSQRADHAPMTSAR
jgi:hypothetical protein